MNQNQEQGSRGRNLGVVLAFAKDLGLKDICVEYEYLDRTGILDISDPSKIDSITDNMMFMGLALKITSPRQIDWDEFDTGDGRVFDPKQCKFIKL